MKRYFQFSLLPSELEIPTLVMTSILAFGGFLLVMSASTQFSQEYFDDGFYYGFRHLTILIVGLVALYIAWRIPLEFWFQTSLWLLLGSFLLLLLVFIPGIGKEVNASSRWINLFFFSFQPAEILKFTLPVFYAFYLTRYADEITTGWQGLIIPIGVILLITGLLLLQPDFGSAFILAGVGFIIFFLAGMRWRDLIFASSAFIAICTLLVVFQPYRLKRLVCINDSSVWELFLHQCYQVAHSLIAIERGGLWGVGLGGSIQKYSYLPEAHTDFSFSIIVEEMGFIFCLVLLVLFFLFFSRVMYLGRRCLGQGKRFSAYLLYSLAVLWLMQVLINVGVALGYVPVTGLPLPFLSYGGSNLVVNLFLVGVVLRAYGELIADDQVEVRQ